MTLQEDPTEVGGTNGTEAQDEHSLAMAEQLRKIKPLRIVCLGASAGGLEAIETFFDAMPPNSGMAFVVVQHLSPDFKSLMDELLARHTKMKIHRVENEMVVEADCIYLIPPKKEMIISNGRLLLTDKDPSQSLSLPIDVFLRSLAQDMGSKAIGVILSGTGTDGSSGIRDIHEAGGLVMVQTEESAKFDGMPRSASATGVCDFELPPEAMPDALLKVLRHPLAEQDKPAPPPAEAPPEGEFPRIFKLLRDAYGLDFAFYKPTTVSRRIERRVTMQRSRNVSEYVQRLETEPAELDALYKDLLIGVTQFFRDPEAFSKLEVDVIPKLIRQARGREIRVWVAGCATGEEVYSLAILFRECARHADIEANVKIFATDLHRESLEIAASGVYTEDSMENISPNRREKYFTRENDQYFVLPELRRMVVFAEHNVIKDPPFTKLDLISCRNLLIYLQPIAQKKVLSLFHFALNRGGRLFLGPSESLSELEEEFDTIDSHWKLFVKRRDTKLPAHMGFSVAPSAARRPTAMTTHPIAQGDLRLSRSYESLLDMFIPPGLLITEGGELIHTFGDAGRYLKPMSGPASLDAVSLFEGDLRIAVSAAIQRVKKERTAVCYHSVPVKRDESEEQVKLTVQPVREKHADHGWLLITLEPVSPQPSTAPSDETFNVSEESRQRIVDLEQALQYTRENLQATVEELETSNEELQASNEELLASNEELQSTNEELHSVNEELYTVNGEYERKIKELTELTNDMDNLLRSTDIGTVFLDRELRIRKFTPAIARAFNLMAQDIGRPIDHISYNIDHEDVIEDARTVLRRGESMEREVRSRHGDWLLMRILPYRLDTDAVTGVVMTFVDISELRRANEGRFRLASVLEASGDAIIGKNPDGIIFAWNSGAERVYGYQAEEAIGKPVDILVPHHERSRSKELMAKVRQGESICDEEVERVRKDGSHVMVSLTLSPIRDDAGEIIGISAIGRDITERIRIRQTLRESEERFRCTFDQAAIGMALVSTTGAWLRVNRRLCQTLGYEENELKAISFQDITRPEDLEEDLKQFRRALAGEIDSYSMEKQYIRKDGSLVWCALTTSLVRDEQKNPRYFISAVDDISERKETEETLQRTLAEVETKNAEMESFVYTVSHDLRSPLVTIRGFLGWLGRHIEAGKLDEAGQDIASIDAAVEKMNSLFEDLLKLSRSGRVIDTPESVSLQDLVRDVCASLDGQIQQRGVKINVAKNLPQVRVDPARIRQVLENLISNAVKFMGDQPHPRIDVGVRNDNQEVILSVRDNGIGIDPEYHGKVFGLFEKLDGETDGAGAGLAIVKRIVEAHEGRVWVESDGLGMGSTFCVALPHDA